MAGEQYVELAVMALYDVMVANLEPALRAVEVAQGLTGEPLKTPSEIVDAFVPKTPKGGDGRPLVMVYDLEFEVEEQRNDSWVVPCAVHIIWTDSKPRAAERFGRRWVTAIHNAVKNNSIPVRGVSGMITKNGSREVADYDSSIRHARRVDVEVRVKL